MSCVGVRFAVAGLHLQAPRVPGDALPTTFTYVGKSYSEFAHVYSKHSHTVTYLIIVLSFSFVHFLPCLHAQKDMHVVMVTVQYIKLLYSFTVHLKHCCWKHWHDTTVNWPLHLPSLTQSAIGMKALSPNHHHQCASARALLSVRQSREARRRRASMLVILMYTNCLIL